MKRGVIIHTVINGNLGRKPSYDRASLERICAALDSPSPPSLGQMAKAFGISKQTAFRISKDRQASMAAFDAWGL